VSRTPYARMVSVAARLPGPLLPVGIMAAAASSTGSMFTTATLVGAALIGMSISAPAASALAERVGPRNVLLVSAIVHVLMLVLMVSSIERLTRQDTITSNAVIYALLLSFTLVAGLSTPATATFSRLRWWIPRGLSQERGEGAIGPHSVREGLRFEARIDEGALIAAPVLIAVLSFSFGPTVGLLCSAVLTAVAVPLYSVEQGDPVIVPAEATRFPLGGAEHAQQLLLEYRGLAPDHEPHEVEATGPQDPEVRWIRGAIAAATLALCLGAVLGALWIGVLDAAQVLRRPSLFALTLGVLAAASLTAAGFNARHFTDPIRLRRRRLNALLLLGLSLVLLAVSVLSTPGLLAFVILSALGAAIAAVLGRLLIGLYSSLAIGAPAQKLPTALVTISGGLLLGLVLGLTVAGVSADELGQGWSALVGVVAAALISGIVLGGALWGSPARPRS